MLILQLVAATLAPDHSQVYTAAHMARWSLELQLPRFQIRMYAMRVVNHDVAVALASQLVLQQDPTPLRIDRRDLSRDTA